MLTFPYNTNQVQHIRKRIRRKDWYYRNGKFFANKQCFKLWVTQEAEKAKKAAAEAAAKAAPAESAKAQSA